MEPIDSHDKHLFSIEDKPNNLLAAMLSSPALAPGNFVAFSDAVARASATCPFNTGMDNCFDSVFQTMIRIHAFQTMEPL
jgi:hypothetical protein